MDQLKMKAATNDTELNAREALMSCSKSTEDEHILRDQLSTMQDEKNALLDYIEENMADNEA